MDRESVPSDKKTNVDSTLIKSFLGGDERAFDSLVNRYKNKVFNICFRMLGDYEEADDSAQETFIKVFRALKGFRFESSFSTWLYRIAVNTCKNKLSSLKYRFNRMMVRLDKPARNGNAGVGIEVQSKGAAPHNSIERRERELLIQRALDSLPKEQKMVVVLRDVEGLSYEEVARVTGLARGTVKSKLSRARDKLREKLKGQL
jgi:RNA polymerase sigma-70 factor (ECF subfamily)